MALLYFSIGLKIFVIKSVCVCMQTHVHEVITSCFRATFQALLYVYISADFQVKYRMKSYN